MLTKCKESDALSAGEQTIYRSAVGKAMFLMQYSRAEIYNSVRDCARHMQMAARKHMIAIGRVMKYCVDRPNRGLVLKPNEKWDGSPDFEFTIGGRSDSDYGKDPQTQRSVSGGRVLLCGAPVTFRSSTQKTVALSVMEAELYAAVLCAQDMIYVRNVLLSIGLKVKLSMILECNNQGPVDPANSWSVGGRTHDIDVRQCFLRELKEAGVLHMKWISGKENDSDMLTKNLDGPLFEKFASVYVGKDEYTPDSE